MSVRESVYHMREVAMPIKIKETHPPRGFTRLLARLPIWLFHLHLGWVFGHRFLLLTHRGRKSGLPRQVFLEVLQYDKISDTYCVLAGWGEQSDWVRNVEQTPRVLIDVGRRRLRACAVRLAPEEAERAILDYARRYPLAVRVLPRLMGFRVDGTEEDFRALARLGIVVAFHPTES
jgi:deazaflavin-dependent oxidoreductase (nitroreductase family)